MFFACFIELICCNYVHPKSQLKKTMQQKEQFADQFMRNYRENHFENRLSANVKLNSASQSNIEKIDIKDSIFMDIKNMEQGGAILVKHPQSFVVVKHTLIIGCSATKNGGGLYCTSARFQLYDSAFHECYVPDQAWSGQAFSTTCNYVSINASTVWCCPISQQFRGAEAIIMVGGVQNINQLNSSRNTATQYAAGLATSESVSFALKLSHFVHNESPNHIVALVHIRPDDDISNCNFIKNTVTSDGIFYVSGGYSIIRRCYFRKTSGNLTVFNNAYGPGLLTYEECIFDIPEPKVMGTHTNLYNVKCVFTRKPSKPELPKNSDLNPNELYRMYRYINIR